MPPLSPSPYVYAVCEAVGWAVLYSLPFGVAAAGLLGLVLACTRSPRARSSAASVLLLASGLQFLATICRFWPAASGAIGLAAPSAALPFWNDLSRVGLNAPRLTSLATLAPWLAPLWLAGASLFHFQLLAGWLWCLRLRRSASSAPAPWPETVGRLAAQWNIARPVRLLASTLVDSPAVLGHWRPCILVPASAFLHLSPQHLELLLMHELAHIRRADFLLNACLRSIESLLFYHPAVWWMARVVRREREHCCDDEVAARTRNPRRYAEALATLERSRSNDNRPATTVAMAAKGGQLMQRIERLLSMKSAKAADARRGLLLTAIAAITLAAWPLTQHAAPTRQSWEQWLNDDVVYIITDAERAAFVSQTSDEARQRFADQFWTAHDKQEHYRRLSWVNSHYETASGTAGWRTDRGHMYVVYGPPDEIEVHPAKDDRYATEAWMYRKVAGAGANGIFTFVDRTGTRDFRLAPTTLR